MDPATAGILAGGAGLIGTYLSNQQSQNNAQKQMDFQKEMSNTAHQREVEDLRRAGLNPILSALGAGASTPSGAQGSVNDYAPGISKGMETAIAVKTQNKQLQGMDAEIGNKNADTENKGLEKDILKAQAISTAKDAELKTEQAKQIKELLPHMMKKAKAEGDYSEINQIMGIINSGAATAADLLGLGLKIPFKMPKGKQPEIKTEGKP